MKINVDEDTARALEGKLTTDPDPQLQEIVRQIRISRAGSQHLTANELGMVLRVLGTSGYGPDSVMASAIKKLEAMHVRAVQR
jgi:hypothetical protein